MAAAYPHFRFIRQANAGLAATRNRALAEANCDYYCPFDADNLAMPAMIERLGSTMQNSDSSQNAIKAMAELARGIDGLVKHIRAEQADIRIHIEEQGDTNRKLRELIEAMLREDNNGARPN